MKFSTISIAALSAQVMSGALAADSFNGEEITLTVSSESDEINGKGLTSIHEGAGINYVFLADGNTELYYDADKKVVYQPFLESSYQFLAAIGSYFALTVTSSGNEFTFDDEGVLYLNGSSSGFYACKDTKDPYNYSQKTYELMYYPEDAPESCLALTLSKAAASEKSSSSETITSSITTFYNSTTLTSTTTETDTCTECEVSTYEGEAKANYVNTGSFVGAAALALAAIII
ncbi:hypothetical protein B5S28_g3961 [[Candida] boidinii]|nr:hypothetical protein B5S28_g3961 [[Candida] boidinii]OWB63540.1 hypothetical protein B5S29_g4525 [[Candida] boidinii]OWB74366.1 hypothetical protein B5S31_g4156 [[Candida] boidinii]OWB80440.1 hypothetical protein B5S32_g4718 [[Candida] boidinii]